MDRTYLLQALKGASGHLRTLQDADMWPEQETAAAMIEQVRESIAVLEPWESVITLPVNFAAELTPRE